MRWLAGAVLAASMAVQALAQAPLAVPPLTARVIDQTGTLDAAQRQALDDRLAALEREKGSQVVMLMVPTTQPEDIAAYAWRVADAWKIGRKNVGDGVLVVVAKNDRRMRIEVARTLEGAIPDLAARRIIDERMAPAFRSGDFAGGLQAAADGLAMLIRGENLPAPPSRAETGRAPADFNGFWLPLLFLVPIVAGSMRRIMGRRAGALATGGAAAAVTWFFGAALLWVVLAGVVALVFALVSGFVPVGGRGVRGGSGPVIFPGGWGGGGSGGSGGGGFSSGGGGSFGGGGASGDW